MTTNSDDRDLPLVGALFDEFDDDADDRAPATVRPSGASSGPRSADTVADQAKVFQAEGAAAEVTGDVEPAGGLAQVGGAPSGRGNPWAPERPGWIAAIMGGPGPRTGDTPPAGTPVTRAAEPAAQVAVDEPAAKPEPLIKREPVDTDSLRLFTFKGVLIALLGITFLLTLYVGATFFQVRQEAGDDDAQAVDAIVVLGAAQYDCEPSPVLKGRLDKAIELFEAGHADTIIPTGSNQPGDNCTEGFTGFAYLREQGIPEENIEVVVDGSNTYEQMTATANVLGVVDDDEDEDADPVKVLLVSDPYHNLRVRLIAEDVGFEAYVSPTDLDSSNDDYIRETVAVSLGRIIGFRRTGNLN